MIVKWLKTPERGRLLSWSFSLYSFLMLAVILVGSRYVLSTPLPDSVVGKLYAVLAWSSHMALLAYAPWFLLILPFVVLVPHKKVVTPVTVLVASALFSTVLLDTLIYAQNRFHFSPLVISILEQKTWTFALVYLFIFTAFFFQLGKRVAIWKASAIRRTVAIVLVVGAQVAVHFMHIWADANYYTPITGFTTALPFFYPATAKKMMARMGLLDIEKARQMQRVAALNSDRDGSLLAYPLNPLHYDTTGTRLNVLLIEVDAWRYQSFNDSVAPNIVAFGAENSTFLNHYSGGNSTRMGNFSLFYGLPGTYWNYFEGQQRSPVMIDLFMERNYELNILPSAPIYRPGNLDRTAFSKVPDLRLETTGADTPWERDRIITDEWLNWVDQRDESEPFFSFLYLDGPTASSYPPELDSLFRDKNEKYGRYLRSIYHNDSLVGTVLSKLQEKSLLENTVVVITADHGEEFNEFDNGFHGHGSAFSQWQTRVPLVIHWPGRDPETVATRTSHNDLVATLVNDLLGVTNPASDFCSGESLWRSEGWEWLIVGSYHNFAVLEPHQVTVSYPGGYYELRDSLYEVTGKDRLNRSVLTQSMTENGRFFR